jgi:fatty-acyl-CoA synthase
MLEGLVQHDHPLTLQHVLDRMRRMYADSEVATLTDGGVERATFAEVCDRVDRLCRALASLGVGEGDRVATFAWNSQRHLEAYLAAPCMGAVLHTLNIRLFADQLTYIANHAKDKVVLVDDSLVPLLEKVAPTFETVEHYVVMGEGDTGSLPGNVVRYEELLAGQDAGYDYPELDDRMAAGLCYTSGTTGNPKGVLYSHRSNVLHALGSCLADTLAISHDDRILPVVPMFHANAWGVPYAATFVGADLIMPAQFLQPEPLCRLIVEERVTVAPAVPTIWRDVLRHADETKPDMSSLRIVPCGGSAVPLELMKAFEERHGVPIVQAWGMTETSPLGSVARVPKDVEGDEAWRYRAMAGRISPLVEARLVDDNGDEVEWNGEATGELEVRGPWIASDYYEDPSGRDRFHDGWLKTGDIAAIDPRGYIRITDRAKDVIKSGGEWISSVELEGELMAHPDVVEAAVIAKPDDRWQERPLACVVLNEGAEVSAEDLREHLSSRVAKWWLPDEIAFVDEVPKTSVGKFDKKVLRKQLAEGELQREAVGAAER